METSRLFKELEVVSSCQAGGARRVAADIASTNAKLKYRIKHLNEVVAAVLFFTTTSKLCSLSEYFAGEVEGDEVYDQCFKCC